jgi:hypothetical protein
VLGLWGLEYQIRAQQFVTAVTNPTTGMPMAVLPFRTNIVRGRFGWTFLL